MWALVAMLWGGAFTFFSLMVDTWDVYSLYHNAFPSKWSFFVLVVIWGAFVRTNASIIWHFFHFSNYFTHLTFHQILMRSMNPKLASLNTLPKIIWYIVILLFGSINNSKLLEFMRLIVGTKVMLELNMLMESPSRHNV